MKLTPEQKYLVSYHSEYMLFRKDERAPVVDFSRYDDHRAVGQGDSRQNRQKTNISSCVDSLDVNNESHQETYRRIVARGRHPDDVMGNVEED